MENFERSFRLKESTLRGTVFETLLREAASIFFEELELHKERLKPQVPGIRGLEEVPSEPEARLIPLTKWNQFHPGPPLSGLKHLVFNSKTNGFDRCIRRIGRRVYILEAEFFKWVEEVNRGRGR
jgi:hypothetical protein